MDNEYLSLTELGKLFGVSSHKVGRELKDIGYRTEDGRPSPMAFHQNYVRQRLSEREITFWVWDQVKTVALLEDFGWKRFDDMASD